MATRLSRSQEPVRTSRRVALAVAGMLAAACAAKTEVVTVPAADTTAPLVLYVAPAAGATGVAVNGSVMAVFSETMKAATLSPTTVTLRSAAGEVTGAVGVSGDARSVTLAPAAPLSPGVLYTATVAVGATDAAGNPLTLPVSWSFTTAAAADTTAPKLLAVTPPAGARMVDGGTAITATFDEPLDCTTVDGGSFRLFEGGLSVPGYATCSGAAITFHPLLSMPTDTILDASLTPAITDLAGNRIAAYDWTFGVRPWTRQMGTATADYAFGVATDGAGNVLVAGYTDGALDGQASAGGFDLFVVKYDANGAKLWTRQLGTAAGDYATGVATDGAGNVFVAGRTDGALDGQASAGGSDLFVVKYDANGVKLWTRQLGTANYDVASGVATDGAGNVFVAGYTLGALDGQASAGGYDLFVVKYDANGMKLWTRQLGTAGWDNASGVATDGAGNVFVAGRTDGALDGQASAGGSDLFVVKYDPNGLKLWTRQLGTAAADFANGVATDGAGNVFVAGYTGGALDGQASAGGYDLFVVKYQSDGRKR
jgi:Bacterial Ig-like domain/Beta-propeller repeat